MLRIKMRGVLIILTAFLAVTSQAAKQSVESLAAGRNRTDPVTDSRREERFPLASVISMTGVTLPLVTVMPTLLGHFNALLLAT